MSMRKKMVDAVEIALLNKRTALCEKPLAEIYRQLAEAAVTAILDAAGASAKTPEEYADGFERAMAIARSHENPLMRGTKKRPRDTKKAPA